MRAEADEPGKRVDQVQLAAAQQKLVEQAQAFRPAAMAAGDIDVTGIAGIHESCFPHICNHAGALDLHIRIGPAGDDDGWEAEGLVGYRAESGDPSA